MDLTGRWIYYNKDEQKKQLIVPCFQGQAIQFGQVCVVDPDDGVRHDAGHPLGRQVLLVRHLESVENLFGRSQTHLDGHWNRLGERTPG